MSEGRAGLHWDTYPGCHPKLPVPLSFWEHTGHGLTFLRPNEATQALLHSSQSVPVTSDCFYG